MCGSEWLNFQASPSVAKAVPIAQKSEGSEKPSWFSYPPKDEAAILDGVMLYPHRIGREDVMREQSAPSHLTANENPENNPAYYLAEKGGRVHGTRC